MKNLSINQWVYLKQIAASIIWGATFVTARFVSQNTPPLLSATIRFFIASLVLLGFLALSKTPLVKLNLKQFLTLLFIGFCGIFLYNIFFFYGLFYISASRASLITALNPAIIAIISSIFLKEELSIAKIFGIIVSLIGTSIIIIDKDAASLLSSGKSTWLGDTLIFGCVITWVIYSIFSKKTTSVIGPLQSVTYSILFGTIMLFFMTAAVGELNFTSIAAIANSWPSMLSLFFMGCFSSAIAFIWYYDGIQKIGATNTGIFIALSPFTAVLLGTAFLAETLNFSTIIGGGLIIYGIFLCNKKKKLLVVL